MAISGFSIGDTVELTSPLVMDYHDCREQDDPPDTQYEFSLRPGEQGVIVSLPNNFLGGLRQAVFFDRAPNFHKLWYDGGEIGPGHYIPVIHLRFVHHEDDQPFIAGDINELL